MQNDGMTTALAVSFSAILSCEIFDVGQLSVHVGGIIEGKATELEQLGIRVHEAV